MKSQAQMDREKRIARRARFRIALGDGRNRGNRYWRRQYQKVLGRPMPWFDRIENLIEGTYKWHWWE